MVEGVEEEMVSLTCCMDPEKPLVEGEEGGFSGKAPLSQAIHFGLEVPQQRRHPRAHVLAEKNKEIKSEMRTHYFKVNAHAYATTADDFALLITPLHQLCHRARDDEAQNIIWLKTETCAWTFTK